MIQDSPEPDETVEELQLKFSKPPPPENLPIDQPRDKPDSIHGKEAFNPESDLFARSLQRLPRVSSPKLKHAVEGSVEPLPL